MASHSPPTARASILNTLNEAQCRAVCSEAATVAIMAGPGSGKTHTLTSRVVWLVDTLGFQPQNVVVATFTVKAAREMRERITKALDVDRANRMLLGTFHSIARRYLAAYGKHIGLDQKFGIADDSDSRAIIARICKRLQLGLDPVRARAWISKRKAKGSKWTPTSLKRKHSGEAAESTKGLETCYQEYQQQLQHSNLLDYDDLLVRCVQLLQKHPACVSNVQAVLIDEYQDTNGIQYDLMRLFAQKQNRITIVGDPDQSIYGWRSAEIGNLRRLFDDYPGTDQISLEQNYRSSQAILDAALSIIQQDSTRYEKILKPVHDKGTRPTLRRLKSSADEARWIVGEIRRLQIMSGHMLGYEDVAILLRSAALSRQIESALGKAGIAYRMVGGFKFYDRVEIKILLDYLRVIHQPESNDALARIVNVPKRGVGETTIKSLVEEAETSSQSLWTLLLKHCRGDRGAKTKITRTGEQKVSGELIRLVLDVQKKIRQPPSGSSYDLNDILEEVLARLNFEKFLLDTYREDHEQRWANVQEFRALASDFIKDSEGEPDNQLPDIEGLEQVTEDDVLAKFLANVSLASDAQKKGQNQEFKPMVTLSTIHAAKGLEWPVVFIPAAYIGSIPHVRSEDASEERRLLYVAMTRAQALMYLSCPTFSTSYGGQTEVELSNFIEPVAKSFGKVGPGLEPHRLETIGRILGRETPTQQSIYDALPNGFSPNDDEFPEDPNSSRAADDADPSGDAAAYETYQRRRIRMDGTATSYTTEDGSWSRRPQTTMDQSSSFTINTGFISAGAHLASALTDQRDRSTTTNSNSNAKKSKTAHPGGQRTLAGFFQHGAVHSTTVAGAPFSAKKQAVTRMHPPKNRDGLPSVKPTALARPNASAIDPGLSKHKLGAMKPQLHRPKTSDFEGKSSKAHYAQFSSSPARPSTPEECLEPNDEPIGGKETGSTAPLNPQAPRPAATFHNTTVNMLKTNPGVRRPSGLAAPRDEAAVLKKLRKPFRPLTINK